MFSKVKKMEKMRSIQCDICEDVWTYPWMPLKLSLESMYCDGWREMGDTILCPYCVEEAETMYAEAMGEEHMEEPPKIDGISICIHRKK